MITAPDAAASMMSSSRSHRWRCGSRSRRRRPGEAFGDLVLDRLERPATSDFRMRLSCAAFPSRTCLNTSSRLTVTASRRASASVLSRNARSPARKRPAGRFSTVRTVSRRRDAAVEAKGLDRLAGRRLLGRLAQEVVHRPHPAKVGNRRTSASPCLSVRAEPGRWRPVLYRGSSLDSITVRWRGASELARSSSTSATKG